MNEVSCSFLVYSTSFLHVHGHVQYFSLRTVPPTILEDPVPVSVFSPSPLTLTCTAEGYPRPTIAWTRTSPTREVTEFSLPMDNVDLTETAKGLNVTSNLTILVTGELDTGNWSCRANNNFREIVSRPAEVVICCKCLLIHVLYI